MFITDQSFFLYDTLVGLGGGTTCHRCSEGECSFAVCRVGVGGVFELEARRFLCEPLLVRRHLCNRLLHGWKASLVLLFFCFACSCRVVLCAFVSEIGILFVVGFLWKLPVFFEFSYA